MMNSPASISRRTWLRASAAAGSSLLMTSAAADVLKPRWLNERISFAGVGLRYQGSVDLHTASQYGDVVAVCDVDKNVRDQARASFGSRPRIYEDYHELLKQKNIDALIIGTPDHWHVQIAADALRAGKAVYVEKPLTLTIDEGKFLRKVVEQTQGVLQVGSWQRSDARFRLAVEMVHAGRVGKLKRVEVVLGKNVVGGPFSVRKPPSALNWHLWQGQAPKRPYVEERSHYTFRWWYDYSGGQMTDWGCHHVDIAQWAINSNPVEIETHGKLPKPHRDAYSVPVDFHATIRYANGVEMSIADHGRNGIMFTGDQGRIFVNRGTISGRPVEQLEKDPLPREDFAQYRFDNLDRQERRGKLDSIVNHMGNFVDCVEARRTPISDCESQHRSASTCHLANISLQVGRKIRWDPQAEQIQGDDQASQHLSRERRRGFELV